ncbi:Alpha/Beta hydrolase protein [Xylariales sp. PMI_506]|nr:Alpha/Beta hydrolase protein [Xylariales sp. PMI_506]
MDKAAFHAPVGPSSRKLNHGWAPLNPLQAVVFTILGFIAFLNVSRIGTAASQPLDLRLNSKHDASVTYPGEQIAWKPCGQSGNRSLECSTITVPMDHFNASNSGNKTFSVPLIRLRNPNATLNLFVNPGGPGGPGLGFVRSTGEHLSTIVGDAFHVVSFDPRGIGKSKPAATCFPNEGTSTHIEPLIHSAQRRDDAPEIYAWVHNYVRACAESMGEHGKYINTPQTAADMNSIINALGQKDMMYWGFSYGSLLGQTYAALFPQRARRIIIDGIVEIVDYYDRPLGLINIKDAENVMNGFFVECAKAGPSNCALASLGVTGPDIRVGVMDFIAQIQEQPLGVYINATHNGILTAEKVLLRAFFQILYQPKGWAPFADRLAKLVSGNSTDFFLAYGLYDAFDVMADGNSFVKLNDGATGPKHWPQDRDSLLRLLRPAWNESLFGQLQAKTYFMKQQWVVPRTHDFSPTELGINGDDMSKTGVIKTAHPLLILSTTYDPVCPLSSARSANAAFAGSRLVEVKAFGHCSLSMPSSCLAQRVRDFLGEGILPDGNVSCDIDGSYFPIVEKDGDAKVVTTESQASEQELALRKAQAALAEQWHWNMYY